MHQALLPLLHNEAAQRVLQIYHDAGFEARFVGGCVRDALLGRSIKDIDLATTAPPGDSEKLFKQLDIRYIPTGIKYGTLTVLIDGQSFEVTTLRQDVATDGRYAEIAYTRNWEEDAARRDFTINALSVDMHGVLYDYHHGLNDMEHRRLRFIGHAHDRVTEDYLRILRYFRFLSVLEWSAQDEDALTACRHNKSHLQTLSRERVQSELYKLLLGSGCVASLSLIAENAILSAICPLLPDVENLALLVNDEPQWAAPDPFRRLLALFPHYTLDGLKNLIVPGNREKKRLAVLKDLASCSWPLIKKLYFFGKEAVMDDILLRHDTEQAPMIRSWIAPVFPLRADDVMHVTNGPGPALGHLLKACEEWWVDQAFQPSKDDLLAYAAQTYSAK